MPKKIYYEYQGQKHCLTEWSKILNVPVNTLWSRIRRYGVNRALVPTLEAGIVFNGRSYTWRSLAAAFDISPTTLRNKYNEGMSFNEIQKWAEATSTMRANKKRKPIGDPYLTKKEAICWKCANKLGDCSWSFQLVPVENVKYYEGTTRVCECSRFVKSPPRKRIRLN